MTDREMLELAARAAGITGTYVVNAPISGEFRNGIWNNLLEEIWNPLRDPGDALRLLQFLGDNYGVQVIIGCGTNVDLFGIHHCDTYEESMDLSATMRAITRAAAEIERVKRITYPLADDWDGSHL